MANILEITNGLFDSATTVAGVVDKYTTKQAELSTQTKNIQLQTEINGELARIKQSSNYKDWNTNINSFFEKIKGSMSNPDSPYYCRNNLQAEMFNKILDQNQLNVSEHVNGMVMQRELEQNKVDVNNGIQAYMQLGHSGQQLYDECKELINNANAVGTYSPIEYEKMNDFIFYNSYSSMYENMFNATAYEAIKRGDSLDKIWTVMQNQASALMKTDSDSIPVSFDKKSYDDKIKKDFQSRYNAMQQDIWNESEKKFAENWDNVKDQTSAQGRNSVKSKMRRDLDNIKGTGLMSPEQFTKWTNWLALEDYYDPAGTTTSSQRKSAANKMDPQDYIDFYMNAIRYGDASTVYKAWKDFQDDVLDEYKQVTGNLDATIIDVEKDFPKVGKFLDYAAQNLPPEFQDVVKYAENALQNILSSDDDKDKYKEELNSTLDIVKDMLFDADIKNAGQDMIKELKARATRAINARLGNLLEKKKDYKEYFGKDYEGINNLNNYQEGVIDSKEERMAKAIRERDANPELVYTKANGVVVPYALQEGLSRLENDERSEIKELIKNQTGQDVADSDIKMSYESDGRNDVTARRRYTINGYDYRFRTEDGKHIILEKKKNGNNPKTDSAYKWEQVRTVTQQKEYDSPKAVAKRTEAEVSSIVRNTNWKNASIPDGGFVYTDKNGNQQSLTYLTPDGEERAITQTYWNYTRANGKKRIILEYLEKNPEAAKEWLDKLEGK